MGRETGVYEGELDAPSAGLIARRETGGYGWKLDAELEVARVAARQHGMITIAQLLAAGLSERAIGIRVAGGWLTAFERDRARDGRLLVAGYRVLRITWRQLIRQPAKITAMLGAVLTP